MENVYNASSAQGCEEVDKRIDRDVTQEKIETLYGNRVHKFVWNENHSDEIILYAIDHWGHKWPGNFFTDRLKPDDSLKGFDAAEIIWDFFKKHRKGVKG